MSNEAYMPEAVLPPPKNREANSTHRLSRLEVQQAISDIKRFMEARFESDLKVVKVRTTRCTFVDC